MSARRHKGPPRREAAAVVFAALGDETRLLLLARLASGESCSIAELTEATRHAGSQMTRQAVTKHLRVLEQARMVRCTREGRESVFELRPQRIEEMKEYLEFVAAQWEQALGRLKLFVEKES